jgi:hypothetical protein
MKMMTKAIETKLETVIAGESLNPPIIVHYFNPSGIGDWYVFDGEKTDDGDWKFYGLTNLLEKELGYFYLSELVAIKCPPFGLGVERDRHFFPTRLSDVS